MNACSEGKPLSLIPLDTTITITAYIILYFTT